MVAVVAAYQQLTCHFIADATMLDPAETQHRSRASFTVADTETPSLVGYAHVRSP